MPIYAAMPPAASLRYFDFYTLHFRHDAAYAAAMPMPHYGIRHATILPRRYRHFHAAVFAAIAAFADALMPCRHAVRHFRFRLRHAGDTRDYAIFCRHLRLSPPDYYIISLITPLP